MKNVISFLCCLVLIPLYGQIGINTSTPNETLHVNGSLQITNDLNVGGDSITTGDSGNVEQTLISRGPGLAPEWSDFKVADISFSSAGTVIAVGGNFVIAQEITVQLTDDFNYTNSGTAVPIPNFTTKLIDNENTFTSDATGNSFTVKEKGTYMITMNYMIQSATYNTNPVIGIWNDTTGEWIARVNDTFNVTTTPAQSNQGYTLITALVLSPDNTYSLRVFNTSTLTIKSKSTGSTGTGNVSMVTVKRMK